MLKCSQILYRLSINSIESSNKIIEYETPLVLVLGPLLFLIYINNVPVSLQTISRLFATDTALQISGKLFWSVQI